MTTNGMRGPSRREWMSIHEASAMIGVSPATLRRWSDAGDIKAFTTPGGHRRFSRAAVAGMLPADRRGRPNLGQLGETPERMTRIYRRELHRATQWAPWIEAIDDADRQPLRDHGQRIAAALLAFFDATDPEERGAALATAEDSAAVCGRIAGRIGLPVGRPSRRSCASGCRSSASWAGSPAAGASTRPRRPVCSRPPPRRSTGC